MIDSGGSRIERLDGCRGIAVVITRIELEAVDTVLGLHIAQLRDEICCGIGVGKVVASGVAVPPVEDSGTAVRRLQEIAFGCQVAVFGRVGRHEGAYPKHNAEAEGVEFVHHGFGVGETLCLEVEIAVVTLPVVVNHQYTGGEAVVDDSMGVTEDVRLVLVVHQFDPCVVLRHSKEERIGQETRSGEILRLCGKVGFTEGTARLDGSERIGRVYPAILSREYKGTIRPHIGAVRGKKERYELIVLVLRMEVESGLVGIGLISTETDGRSPPIGCGRSPQRTKNEEQRTKNKMYFLHNRIFER